jgi:hypothetical protein
MLLYYVICRIFNNAVSRAYSIMSNGEMIVRKEVVVAQFKDTVPPFLWWDWKTTKTCQNYCYGRGSNQAPSKYKSETFLLHLTSLV